MAGQPLGCGGGDFRVRPGVEAIEPLSVGWRSSHAGCTRRCDCVEVLSRGFGWDNWAGASPAAV